MVRLTRKIIPAILLASQLASTPILVLAQETCSGIYKTETKTSSDDSSKNKSKKNSDLIQEKISELIPVSKKVANDISTQKEIEKQEEEARKIAEEKARHEQEIIDTAVETPLCISGSTVKSYMDGAKVTNKLSAQYLLLQTMHINEKGNYETDDGYIGVALGSYYGPIGTKYIVTLSTGKVLKVIKADAKADEHVYNGCNHKQDNSMMELIIDTATAGSYYGTIGGYVAGGNFNNVDDYNGAIVDMKKVTIE